MGTGYSGNGDFLAFAFNTDPPFKPSEGPTITTGIVYDRTDNGVRSWFILQEGGYPKEIGAVLQLLTPRGALLRNVTPAGGPFKPPQPSLPSLEFLYVGTSIC